MDSPFDVTSGRRAKLSAHTASRLSRLENRAYCRASQSPSDRFGSLRRSASWCRGWQTCGSLSFERTLQRRDQTGADDQVDASCLMGCPPDEAPLLQPDEHGVHRRWREVEEALQGGVRGSDAIIVPQHISFSVLHVLFVVHFRGRDCHGIPCERHGACRDKVGRTLRVRPAQGSAHGKARAIRTGCRQPLLTRCTKRPYMPDLPQTSGLLAARMALWLSVSGFDSAG